MLLNKLRKHSLTSRPRSNELCLDLITAANMENSLEERGFPNECYVEEETNQDQEVPDLPQRAGSMASSRNSDRDPTEVINDSRDSEDETMSYRSEQSNDIVLPSHMYKSLRGLPSQNALKQNMRRTLKERRPKSRGNVTDGFSVDNEEVISNEDQVFGGVDLTPNEFATFMGRETSIKEVPTSITRKRTIKRNMQTEAKKKGKIKHISAWKHFKLTTAMGWQHFKAGCKELLYVMDIWRGHLKIIQGMFGSGVLSYFVLLRWLFLINLVAFFSVIFFLFIPQMVFYPSYKYSNASFEGWELITGDGYFTQTELYYGWYTNQSIGLGSSNLVYKMPLAYLFIGGGYLLLCLAILVYSMAESYRENYIYAGDEFSYYISKLFCAWDYGITNTESATLKQKSIFNDFKEAIAEDLFQRDLSSRELCCLVFIRVITNLIVMGLIGGGAFLIFYCATQSFKIDAGQFEKLLLPIVVSALNLVLPWTFRIISSLEQYIHPKTAVQVNLARTVLLKLTSLGVILISLFTDVTKCRKGEKLGERECLPAMKECWETYIGITFYRLILVDFIFLLLSTFFGEFVRSLIAKHNGWCGQNVGFPGFDISRNVLDLIYAQSLAWIGTFFSPLLSTVNVIKFFILFYVKRISVINNCKASQRPFRAAKMNLLFLILLAVSFMVSILTIGYCVMSESDKMLNPSKTCGPFRDKSSMYSVIMEEIHDFPLVIRTAIGYLSSASFLAMIFCILGIVVYYYKMLKDSNEKKITLLKEQIALAGQDKLYLIQRITTGVGLQGVAVDVAIQPE